MIHMFIHKTTTNLKCLSMYQCSKKTDKNHFEVRNSLTVLINTKHTTTLLQHFLYKYSVCTKVFDHFNV